MMERMRQKMKETSKPKYEKDDFWYPTKDKTGNSSAEIRFLYHEDAYSDDVETSDAGMAKSSVVFKRHEWKNKADKWYIEYCPLEKTGNCPVCEANSEVYEQLGKDAAKTKIGHRSRKTHYVANVLIVKDPANPENEGTIRLFRFGATIWEMLNDKIAPKFADEVAADPWNMYEGVNFKLKTFVDDKKQVNYSKSSFADVSDVSKMVDFSKFTDLSSFVADDKYKSYEDLLKRFNSIEGIKTVKPLPTDSHDEHGMPNAPSGGEDKPARPARPSKPKQPDDAATPASSSGNDDDDNDELEKMMAELNARKNKDD